MWREHQQIFMRTIARKVRNSAWFENMEDLMFSREATVGSTIRLTIPCTKSEAAAYLEDLRVTKF